MERFYKEKKVNQKLLNQAKKEFEKVFNQYARLMFKLYSILFEQPALYYSEKLAQQNKQQAQTKFYLAKIESLKKQYKRK